jgi:hypothetical protein
MSAAYMLLMLKSTKRDRSIKTKGEKEEEEEHEDELFTQMKC